MKSQFKQLHPLVLFAYYTGALVLMFIMQHPVFLVSALIVIVAVNFWEDHLRGLSRWFFLIITTGILIVILNPIFNERGSHLLFEVFQHRITLEAVVYGVMNALLITGVMALFVSYNEVMAPNKLLYLFAKFLPQFAVLLMLTLRFIPLMKRRLAEISAVQSSRGISVVQGRWVDKAKTGILYVQVLLVYSLEEAIQTADSMKARGYRHGKRSSYEYFTFKTKDLFGILFLLIIFILALLGRLYGNGYFTVYPVMESVSLTGEKAMFLFIFLLFIVFPLLVEIGGFIRWRISNWKT